MEDTGVYFSVIQPGRELFFPMTGVIDFDYSFVYDNGLQYWTASPMTTTSMTFGWYNGKWIDFTIMTWEQHVDYQYVVCGKIDYWE